jgi:hypothetical protein
MLTNVSFVGSEVPVSLAGTTPLPEGDKAMLWLRQRLPLVWKLL